MSKIYEFDDQKKQGDAGAARLDAFFSRRYAIEPVGMEDEWRGIDRRFASKEDGERFTVEYKTDLKAPYTHNFFVETVSSDVSGRLGWAFTCQADYLVAYVPHDEIAYICKPSKIKGAVKAWEKKYGTKSVPNKGYHTIGIAVPLREFEKIAEEAVSL